MTTFRPRHLLLAGLAASTLLCSGLRAADHDHGDSDDESPVHERMEEMGKSMRVLARGLNSADPAAGKADYLEALQKMQLLAVEAKALVPSTMEKVPEADRPAKLAGYRADLAATIAIMLEIEQAVLSDQWDAAKEAFGKLRAARKDGHEKYAPEEEH